VTNAVIHSESDQKVTANSPQPSPGKIQGRQPGSPSFTETFCAVFLRPPRRGFSDLGGFGDPWFSPATQLQRTSSANCSTIDRKGPNFLLSKFRE